MRSALQVDAREELRKLVVTWLGQSQQSPKANRVWRLKEPPTPPLVDRDSATRQARRLAVQSDVGERSSGS